MPNLFSGLQFGWVVAIAVATTIWKVAAWYGQTKSDKNVLATKLDELNQTVKAIAEGVQKSLAHLEGRVIRLETKAGIQAD